MLRYLREMEYNTAEKYVQTQKYVPTHAIAVCLAACRTHRRNTP